MITLPKLSNSIGGGEMGYFLGLFVEVLPFVVVVGTIYVIIRAVWRKRRGLGRDNWLRELTRLVFVCYMAGLLGLVWAPNAMWGQIWLFLRYGWPMDWWKIMFKGTYSFDLRLGDVVSGAFVHSMRVGNVAMFVPLGLLLPLRWPQLTIPKALGAGACIDLAIEAVQPVFGRSFDMEDLICNTLGILLGLGAYRLLRSAAPRFIRACRGEG